MRVRNLVVLATFQNFKNLTDEYHHSFGTKRNGQPPKSQLAKKSTCQKVNLSKSQLAKSQSIHKMTKMLWLMFLAS
jgi:hypothetical protein